MFEVLCDRYKNAYVGTLLSGKDIEAITVEQINKSLGFIKIQYRDNRIDELVTTTLDTVFKKMVDYVPLLPDDATKWSCCLPSMFYNSLTQEVKTEMQIQNYQIPQTSLLLTKRDQLQSMSTCRSIAGQADRKVKQVQASVAAMINNQITGIKVVGHHLKPYSGDQFQPNLQVNTYNPLS